MFLWDQSSRSKYASKIETRRAFLRSYLQINTCLLYHLWKTCRNHHDKFSFHNDSYLHQRFKLWWVLEILGTELSQCCLSPMNMTAIGRGYSLEWFDWCACVLPWCVAKWAERHNGDAINDVIELLHQLLTSDRWLADTTTSISLTPLSFSTVYNAGIIPFIDNIMIHV